MYSEIIPIGTFANALKNILKARWLRELEGLGLVIAKQSDNVYSFVYKGVEIFKGTKAEAETALKEYFENSKKGGLEKYLDEVLERRKIFLKWADKFDTNFAHHISGDVNLEIFKTLFGDYVYVGTQGQGGHYINKFLEIINIVEPSGKTLAQIADDIPFKAKVNIKSLNGKIFPKSAASSMFPKNWNLKRIQEEVALVYENTVNKGVGLNPNSVNQIFQQYKFKCSTGSFDILIEVDSAKNIMNAYPKI